MKTNLIPPLILGFLSVFALRGYAQIPVTDIANLTSNQIAHIENIAKWIESIAQLKTQITQLKQQIQIQGDIRDWSGDPVSAGAAVTLNALGNTQLTQAYGQTRAAILSAVNSLDSLAHTGSGTYRALPSADLDGNALLRDEPTFRRYAVLDATQTNAESATSATQTREQELQREIATTLAVLKSASTDAEAQKLAAKLAALNGQLGQVEAARKREVDAVVLQKIANDARIEQERLAAAELAAKDDFLANQRVTAYMKTLRVRNP
jgi:hypothetical protein